MNLRTFALVVSAGLFISQQVASASLADELAAKEAALDSLASRSEITYNSRCSKLSGCSSDQSVPACGNTFSTSYGFHCNSTFGVDETMCGAACGGLVRSMSDTVVRFPPGVSFTDPETQAFVCSSKNLDDNFKNAVDNGPLQAWTYIGHNSGSIRIYPGSPQSRDDDGICSTYDARLRPWFIAASSGPKDIVIIMDRSRSMNAVNNVFDTNGATRLAAVRSAVNAVLGTLTPNDYVNVIAFGSSTQVIGRRIAASTLFRAETASVDSLKSSVEIVTVEGNTVMAPAFTKAFDLFAASSQTGESPTSSGCTKVILFLTDGASTDDSNSTRATEIVLDAIEAGQARLGTNRAHIFTYSMSSDADDTLPKAIACANDGVWARISDGEDPLTEMRGYYQFLATGIVSTQVRWTAPYLDDFGLGQMVTAARPVYDRSNVVPLMVGVVGADITIAELEASGSDFNTIVSALIQRSSTCSAVNLSACDLQHLRGSDNACPSPAPALATCTTERTSTTTCSSTGANLNSYLTENLNAARRTSSSGALTTAQVTCCAAGTCPNDKKDEGGASAATVGIAVGVSVGGIVLIIVVVIACCLCRDTRPAQARNHQNESRRREPTPPPAPAPAPQAQEPAAAYPTYPAYPSSGGVSPQGGVSPGGNNHHHNAPSGYYPPPPSYEASRGHEGV